MLAVAICLCMTAIRDTVCFLLLLVGFAVLRSICPCGNRVIDGLILLRGRQTGKRKIASVHFQSMWQVAARIGPPLFVYFFSNVFPPDSIILHLIVTLLISLLILIHLRLLFSPSA